MTGHKAGTLGWGRFTVQFLSVVVVFLGASLPAVLAFGMTSTGLLGSVAGSMGAALLACWFWLRSDGALRAAWNLASPPSWAHTLAVALAAAVLIIGWFQLGTLLVRQFGLGAPDVGEVMGFVTESPASLVLWIVLVAWLSAGLGEELLYRGFLMDRLQRLRGVGDKTWLVILLQAVLFGIAHGYQSLSGVIVTGVVGFGLGWLRMRCAGNLWACVIAHALVDMLMMSAAYAGKAGLLPVAS